MQPGQPAWRSPDFPDPLGYLDDAFWSVPAAAALPPLAGGQLPDFLEDAFGWTLNNLLRPAGSWIRYRLTDLGRIVWGAFNAGLTWILKQAYSWERGVLLPFVPSPYNILFPPVIAGFTLSPWDYVWMILLMPALATKGFVEAGAGWLKARIVEQFRNVGLLMWDVADWTRDSIWTGISNITSAVWASARWVKDGVTQKVTDLGIEITDAATWVRDQMTQKFAAFGLLMWDVADWTRDSIWTGISNVTSAVWASARWVKDGVTQNVTDLGDALWDMVDWLRENVLARVQAGIVAGAQEIGGLIREAIEWMILRPFESIAGVIERKLEIPGKLLRSEYRTPFELIDDVLDPIPAVMILAGLLVMLVLFPAVNLIVTQSASIGFEEFFQRQRANVGARIPPFAVLRDGLLRGIIDEDTHDDWLRRTGFSESNVALQKALYQQLPGASDLIRMAVREVFTPAVVERFGQMEDFPAVFADWMAKQGFTEEWARNYWAAHWDLPSATQGFEMFHRGIISEDDLRLLLRALDVMPFWRDKLIKLSYDLVTRVDARRLYQEGVWDEARVERHYRDLGYSPEDARDLTVWTARAYPVGGKDAGPDLRNLTLGTVKQAYVRRLIDRREALELLGELRFAEDDAELLVSVWDFDLTQRPEQRSDLDLRELTRSLIERAYERGLWDFNTAVVELVELGYSQDDAEVILHLVDQRMAEELTELEIQAVLNDLEAGLIAQPEAAERLRRFGLTDRRISYLVQRELLRRAVKTRRLTVSQLQRARRAGIIATDQELLDRLRDLGYNDRDAAVLVALVTA